MGVNTSNFIFCSDCGSKNSCINLFCENCGNEIDLYRKNIKCKRNNTLKTYSNINDIIKFTSKNIAFYKRTFDYMISTESTTTWNWSAFFLSIVWLLYRKMYFQASTLFLICTIIVSIIPYMGITLAIIVPIGMGMYGNYIYLSHIKNKLIETYYLNNYDKDEMIQREGGVSLTIPLISILVSILILFMTIRIVNVFY